MNNSKTKKLVEISILVALAFVLDYVASIYSGWFWPFGGSISLSLVPLAILTFRYGLISGFIGGFVMGLMQLLTGAYIIHPVQLLFDYPLPFAVLGLAGILATKVNTTTETKRMIYLWIATAIASSFRLLCHVISGVVFFSEYAGAQNPWIYSLVYNAPYVIASYIISTIVLTILYQRYSTHLILKESNKKVLKIT